LLHGSSNKSEEEDTAALASQESQDAPVAPEVGSPGGAAPNLKLKLKVSGPAPTASPPPASPISSAPGGPPSAATPIKQEDANLKIKIKVPRPEDSMDVDEQKPTSSSSAKSKGTPLKKSTTFSGTKRL